jgi:DNA end-binding protein Ku
MERSGRVAVGRLVLRTREHLVLIRPTAGILGLETMYFEDEVRRPPDRWTQMVEGVAADLTDAEVGMAERLIGALTAKWEPARYRDPYRERVLDLVRSRAPVPEPASAEEPIGASVPDLMEALRVSLEAIGATSKPRRAPRAGGTGRR